MGSVHGGGNFRAIVAELKDEIILIRYLQPGEDDPSEVELEQLAHAYRLSGSGVDEMANGGVPVTCRVVDYKWHGPLAYTLSPEQQLALAGLS
jgi:hypothetical protein